MYCALEMLLQRCAKHCCKLLQASCQATTWFQVDFILPFCQLDVTIQLPSSGINTQLSSQAAMETLKQRMLLEVYLAVSSLQKPAIKSWRLPWRGLVPQILCHTQKLDFTTDLPVVSYTNPETQPVPVYLNPEPPPLPNPVVNVQDLALSMVPGQGFLPVADFVIQPIQPILSLVYCELPEVHCYVQCAQCTHSTSSEPCSFVNVVYIVLPFPFAPVLFCVFNNSLSSWLEPAPCPSSPAPTQCPPFSLAPFHHHHPPPTPTPSVSRWRSGRF